MTDDERALAWLVILQHLEAGVERVPNTIKHHMLTRGWWEFVPEEGKSATRVSELGQQVIAREGPRWGC